MLEGRLRHHGEPVGAAAAAPTSDVSFDLGWIARSLGGGERRQIVTLAVAFAPDPQGDPEDIAEHLIRRCDLVRRVVERLGGWVGRAEPELQLALWGWPTADEADMRRAVAAGLELAAHAQEPIRCSLDIGIAITPEAGEPAHHMGIVGDMIGGAVMQVVAAAPGQVLMSDTLRRLVCEHFHVTPVGSKPQARHWRVIRHASGAEVRAARRPSTLVGRTWPTGAIEAAWRAVQQGSVRLIAVKGHEGSGKSSLVDFLERTVGGPAGTFHCVECRPDKERTDLYPILRLIESLEESGSGLEPISMAGKPAQSVDPSVKAVADALCALLVRSAKHAPLAVVIEDVQWADPASREVLALLPQRCEKIGRVLLMLTGRPGPAGLSQPATDRHRVSGWTGSITLELGRLTPDEIERLLAAHPFGAGLDRETRLLITEHAQGNPLAAIELARIRVETGDPEAHHRMLARPNRLIGALTRQVDELGPLKPLLQAAAILGRSFDPCVLAAALEMDVRVIEERLEVLAQLGILAVRGDRLPRVWRFVRVRQWSQAYGSVLRTRRRRFHVRIAEALESLRGERDNLAPEVVAHHWKKAGDHTRAFPWLCLAARRAAADGSVASAVSYIQEALALHREHGGVSHAQEEAELMSMLGAQMRALRGSASRDTVAAYERAFALVSELVDRPADLDIDIAWGMATIHLVRGDLSGAVAAGDRLVGEARARGRDDIELMATRLCGTALLLSGRVQDAVARFCAAVAMYDPQRHGKLQLRYVSEPGIVAFAHLASAKALAGDVDGSRSAQCQAIARAAALGHAYTTVNVLGVTALAATHRGEPGTAAALSRAGLVLAKAHGYTYWAARSRLVIAWQLGYRDPVGGLAQVLRELDGYRSTGAGRAAVHASCLAAEVAIRADQPQLAMQLLDIAHNSGLNQGEMIYIPEVMRLDALARMSLGPGARNDALAKIEAAEMLARSQGSEAYAARAARSRAEVEAGSAGRKRPGE